MGTPLSLFDREVAPTSSRRLRPYQRDAIEAWFAGCEQYRRGLAVMPTGTGKTVVAAEVIRRFNGGRVLFLAEQRRILTQAQRKIAEQVGCPLEDIGFEQAERRSHGERIVCGMRQTLANDVRLRRLAERGAPALIVVDEAHHHAGKSGSQYQKIISRFPEALVLGLTATPDRGDKEALDRAWVPWGVDLVDGKERPRPAYKLEIHQAIQDGWLVSVEPRTPGNWEALDLSQVKRVAGELDEAAIEAMLAQVVKEQAKATVEECEKLKSIVFCGRVETAHQLAAAIDAEMGRPSARAIDGAMGDDERDALWAAYEANEFQFLVNVGMAIEGVDVPDCAAVVLTRPFLSRGAWTQRVGRGLRPLGNIGLDSVDTAAERRALIAASAKPAMRLVNFRFLPGRHTLVCPEDIFGGSHSDDEKKKAQELLEDGSAKTVTEALNKAREMIEAERRRRADLAAAAKAKAQLDWGTFDPFGAFGMELPDVSTSEVGPPASPAMKAWLRQQGVKFPDSIRKNDAQRLRNTIEIRQKKHLSTLGQINWLRARGITDAHSWSYEHADQAMKQLQRGQLPRTADRWGE